MYSPKVDEGLIPSLYWLAKARGIPMTQLVNGNLRAMLDTMDVQRELTAVQRGDTSCDERGKAPGIQMAAPLTTRTDYRRTGG